MIFSRSTVLSRAMSLRITRRRSGSSSVSVPARNLRRNLSSSSSAMRVRISASPISRMSLLSIGVSLLSGHELRLHPELRGCQRKRLPRDLGRYTLELEHHASGLHHCDPAFRRSFSLSHACFRRLLRDRLVGEDSDPDL